MTKRKLTLKRLDPWSVLKFGLVANVVGLGILLLAGRVAWYLIVDQLGLIETICDTATDLNAVQECGINGGALFRQAALLGALGVVVMSGVQVFFSFLYNLIADLTGGLSFTFRDDSVGVTEAMTARGGVAAPTGAGDPTTAREERIKQKQAEEEQRQRAAKSRGTGGRVAAPTGAGDPTARSRRPEPASSGGSSSGSKDGSASGSKGGSSSGPFTSSKPSSETTRTPARTPGRPEPTRSPLREKRDGGGSSSSSSSAPTGAGDPTRRSGGSSSSSSSAPTGAGDPTRRSGGGSQQPQGDRDRPRQDRADRDRTTRVQESERPSRPKPPPGDDDPIFG